MEMWKKSYPHFLCGLVWITVDKPTLINIIRHYLLEIPQNMCIILYTVEKAKRKAIFLNMCKIKG